jgi:hypothetical protein
MLTGAKRHPPLAPMGVTISYCLGGAHKGEARYFNAYAPQPPPVEGKGREPIFLRSNWCPHIINYESEKFARKFSPAM